MQFIGVAWTGDDESFGRFIDQHDLTFPQISDDPGDVYARFDVPGQPSFVIVDTDGTTHREIGAVDEALLDELLMDAAAR